MAKVKTLKKEQVLAGEDLKKLQEYYGFTNNLKQKIAEAELSKLSLVNKYSQADVNFKKFAEGLEHKYGVGIAIDMATGEYKTVEEEEENKDGTDTKN